MFKVIEIVIKKLKLDLKLNLIHFQFKLEEI
jgi:hypothetical protein